MNFETSCEIALHLWDYFYLSNAPSERDAKPWRRIECATERIRDSESLMCDSYPASIRVKHAKRVRRAVREILRLIPELDTIPSDDVADALAFFAVYSDEIIDMLSEQAKARPLH